MKKFLMAALAVACAATVHGFAPSSAQAQGYSDDDDYYARRRYQQRRYHNYQGQGDRCGVVIRATGVGYPIKAASRASAIKSWKREVFTVYKRDYSWERAAGGSITCEPYLAVFRCTASARPCP